MKFIVSMVLPEGWFDRRTVVADTAVSQLRMRAPMRLLREEVALRRVNKKETQVLVQQTFESETKCTTDDALTWAESAEAAALRALGEARLSRGFRLYVEPPLAAEEDEASA